MTTCVRYTSDRQRGIRASQDRTIIVSVEGNIGSGKTKLLEMIADLSSTCIVPEPGNAWRLVNNKYNLLAQLYHDRSRWTYLFQTASFIARTQALVRARTRCAQQVIVNERSVFSDRYCFARANRMLGHMSELEWGVYKQWFDWLVSMYAIIPDGFIYLQSDPDDCMKSLQDTARPEERTVTKEYLNVLHLCHEQWLTKGVQANSFFSTRPLLTLSSAQMKNVTAAEQAMRTVQSFISSLLQQKRDMRSL